MGAEVDTLWASIRARGTLNPLVFNLRIQILHQLLRSLLQKIRNHIPTLPPPVWHNITKLINGHDLPFHKELVLQANLIMDPQLKATELAKFLQVLNRCVVSIRLPEFADEDVFHLKEVGDFCEDLGVGIGEGVLGWEIGVVVEGVMHGIDDIFIIFYFSNIKVMEY